MIKPTGSFALRIVVLSGFATIGILVVAQLMAPSQSSPASQSQELLSMAWLAAFLLVMVIQLGLLIDQLWSGGALRRGKVERQELVLGSGEFNWVGPIELEGNDVLMVRIGKHGISNWEIRFVSSKAIEHRLDVFLMHSCTLNHDSEVCDETELDRIPLKGNRGYEFHRMKSVDCNVQEHFVAVRSVDLNPGENCAVELSYYRSPRLRSAWHSRGLGQL